MASVAPSICPLTPHTDRLQLYSTLTRAGNDTTIKTNSKLFSYPGSTPVQHSVLIDSLAGTFFVIQTSNLAKVRFKL